MFSDGSDLDGQLELPLGKKNNVGKKALPQRATNVYENLTLMGRPPPVSGKDISNVSQDLISKVG